MIQDSWDEAFIIPVVVIVVVTSEQQAIIVLQVAIVLVVDTVAVSLQQVSENVDSILILQVDFVSVLSLNESLIDDSHEAVLEVLGDLNQFHVVTLLQIVVVLTICHLKTVGVAQVGEDAILNGSIEADIANIIQTVALTFQVEASQELFHLIQVSLTTTVNLVIEFTSVDCLAVLHVERFLVVQILVHLLVVNNPRVSNAREVVVVVESNIFGEVNHAVFSVVIELVALVQVAIVIKDLILNVFVDAVCHQIVSDLSLLVLDIIHDISQGIPIVDAIVLDVIQVPNIVVIIVVIRSQNSGCVIGHDDQFVVLEVIQSHAQVCGLIHDIGCEEEMREDFVGGWQHDIVKVAIVGDEEGHQMPELIFVDVATGPDEIHRARVPVGHRVEEIEQSLCGDDVSLAE